MICKILFKIYKINAVNPEKSCPSCLRLKRKQMTRFVFLSLMIISVSVAAFSQQAANATLTGTITDQAGALIPGAQITATHKATGVKRETVSNENGLYVFSNMTPGDYEVTLDAKGFAAKSTK